MKNSQFTLSKSPVSVKKDSHNPLSWHVIFDQQLHVVGASPLCYKEGQFSHHHMGLNDSTWNVLCKHAFEHLEQNRDSTCHDFTSVEGTFTLSCTKLVIAGEELLSCAYCRQEQPPSQVEILEASNEELERFAHHVSHDLQEPLNTIIGYLQLARLTMGDDADASVARYLSDASRTSYSMKALIKGLLEYSKAGQQKLAKEEAKLSDVVAAVVLMLDTQIKDSEAQILLGNNPVLHCDKLHYTTLFQNLISNALKFMPEGRKPVIRIEAIEHEDHFELSVSDNGSGIAKELRPRVFQTFDRLGRKDQPGSGLGMAISKRVVEKHGGKIWILDNPEGGATFRWSLPK